MNKKNLDTLEYYKVLEILSGFAQSEVTVDFIKKIIPDTEFDSVKEKLDETRDAIELYQRKGNPSLGGIKRISSIVSRLKMDADLSNKELIGIRDNLYIARSTINYLSESNPEMHDSGRRVKEKLSGLFENKKIEYEIQRCIISDDEMDDDASPELRNIRNSIRRKQENVRERLNEYIRSTKYSKFIQDNVITIRNGRYVIPVKQEFRGNIKGLLHDSSSSGSTLYIEPMDIVNLNNDIRELESDEMEEMDRIRRVLSDESRPYSYNLDCNYNLLIEADLLFAKAAMAMERGYMIPRLNNDKKVRIVKGRHPLIAPEAVVPIDFHIGYDFNTLVITGPNTGGKTVSLKTVGLVLAMAQSGIPVPASEGTELSIFKDIFADIGDEQSIEQSLSTFSSHMTNIISILRHCSEDSLVLLDELGAGTDPAEGSALALAILEKLMEKKSTTVATTHYQQIKIYASVTEGIENASCEFDVSTLKPTYRLLIGIPGKSNALYISRRLGLEDSIVSKAKGFINNDNIDYEDVILSLEKSRQRIEKEKTKAIIKSRESSSLKADLERKLKGIEGEKKKIINEARKEAENILETAKKRADEFMYELNILKKEGTIKGSARIEAEFKTKYKDVFDNNTGTPHVNTTESQISDESYIPKTGDEVLIIDMNQKATVIEPPDKNNEVLLLAGIMKIKMHISNLKHLSAKETEKRLVNTFKLDKTDKNPSLEIDIRGLAADEVDTKVGKFLDDSSLMSINEVFIIHGKGTGTLRSAVHAYLRRNPLVKSFRQGTFGEGESGVTVVVLK
jgi:DNA mismatch repair protein MutS2